VIDRDKVPAMGKTSAAVKFLGRIMTASCLCVAAGCGAQAATLAESSLPLPDFSATLGSASVLPDGTTIIDAPLSTHGASGQILFSNLASNPAFGGPGSSGNGGPGLEAFDDSNLPPTPEFEQELAGAASVTLPANVTGNDRLNDRLSAGLELDGVAWNFAIPSDPSDTETSDSATLALTGLGFVLAGTVGRGPKAWRRLNELEYGHVGRGTAIDMAF
jgi:hypothetical protein